MKLNMTQEELHELIQEIEDVLLNKEIDINNSPQLKRDLESIISRYIEQSINKIEQDNKEYYQKRSQQAVHDIKQGIMSDFQSRSQAVNQQIDTLSHKVDKHSEIAKKINDDDHLKRISDQINNADQQSHSVLHSTKKLRSLLVMFRSRFLMITYSSVIIGIVVAVFLFILIKLF